tara:strand:+ start:1191 stop:1406 length:216 start_codon:yes stop_codon:yes gene_type:complete
MANRKYQAGGAAGPKPNPKPSYNMGGFTYGAGDGDNTPQKENMTSMAKGGGLMGFTNGGGVMDGMMTKVKK